jgi:propanol-preferring alcohol dehydrogenase
MRAWRFTNTHEPLRLCQIPAPEAAPGRVIVDVKAAGLCHSDVGILEDEKWLDIMPVRPVTPGHEVAGVVVSIGEGVTKFAVGDRVAVWPFREYTGYMVDGGFAERISVVEDALLPIPDGVSFEFAAAATDSGMTSHQAIMGVGGVKAGTKVAVIGIGGLGQVGARVAVLNGAEVYAAEVNEEAWPLAESLGVKRVVTDIRELADVGLEVIVDFAGFGDTTAGAIEAISMDGKVVQVGMGRLESTINTYPLIMKRVQLLGSAGGTDHDIAEVMRWMAKGDLTPNIVSVDFDKIDEGLQMLHDGKVRGRLVASL